MRHLLVLSFLCLFAACVLAWTKEDHEIFDLVGALEAAEGKGTTFYSWLDVPTTASTSEISRAYRKKSVQLHPDKNPGLKGAHERFSRLGVVAQILRNREGRERYDFFFKNGVPRWRGTGYYYARYRPGLGSVFVFLIIMTSGVHYLIQRINHRSDLARIDRFTREARLAAWGPKMVPVEGPRKVRVNTGGRAYVDEDGNVVSGKQLDMVVDGNEVYIVEPDGQLLTLDPGAANPPSLRRTWFITLVLYAFRRATGKEPKAAGEEDDSSSPPPEEYGRKGRKGKKASKNAEDSETSSSEALSSGAVTPNSMAKPMPRGPTIMAGGRRRKGTPRKRPEKKEADAPNES